MLLDIVILPPKNIRDKIGKLTKKYGFKYPNVFIVDNKKIIPYLSLFHINTSRSELQKIILVIKKIVKNHHAEKIHSIQFKVNKKNGIFEYVLSNNAGLRSLQKEVFLSIHPFKTGLMPAPRPYRDVFLTSKKQKQEHKKYGRPMGFGPHFTLGMLKNPKNGKKIAQNMKFDFEFLGNTVAITEVNKWWQVTKVLKVFKLKNKPSRTLIRLRRDGIMHAVEVLKKGGVVVYPTDTVYGLAVDVKNVKAVKKLYKLKGRKFSKPIHVIVPSSKWLNKIVKLDKPALKLMNKFFPGPLTVVLPLKAKEKSWQLLSAGTKTMGIRMPANDLAISFVKKFGKPITTTSANISGKKSCYSIKEVKKQFKKDIDVDIYFLDGGRLRQRKPSTIVSIINNRVKIIRQGPIPKKQILKTIS
ncbi:MAG: L-threonylcarbamoyladenylate synthase [bacterium]|nr:L-threonylcarbamoyladenylate synthase [bacterium]